MDQKKKIGHPFKVPENFHNEFKKELKDVVLKQNNLKRSKPFFQRNIKLVTGFAAAIILAFFIGRFSVDSNRTLPEDIDLDVIYNQVSEDDIIEFVIEDDILAEI